MNTKTTYGTAHFISRAAAERYYAHYGYDNVAATVERKLDEGEIHIGAPVLKPGQTLTINRTEDRYFITEP